MTGGARVATAGPEPVTPLPLTGVSVLALEQFQALPFATNILARLGADVVKVELPGVGEMSRVSKPGLTAPDGTYLSGTFLRNNHNKRSVAVDWKTPQGAQLIHRLVGQFDVFAENFRAGALARNELSYEHLSATAPGLVYVSITGFGQREGSPYYSWGAFSAVVEAMAGMYTSARPDGVPIVGAAGPLGDTVTGLYAAIGVLAALRGRDLHGRGQHVDVAMLDCMVAIQDFAISQWSLRDEASPAIGIIDAFRAEDGFFVVVVNRPHQFHRLAELIGRPEWITADDLVTPADWVARLESVIRPGLEAWATRRSRREACEELAAAGIAAGPSASMDELLADPHMVQREMITDSGLIGRTGNPYAYPGDPVKLSATAPHPDAAPPRLGADTREVLAAAGLADAEITALADEGIITVYTDSTD